MPGNLFNWVCCKGIIKWKSNLGPSVQPRNKREPGSLDLNFGVYFYLLLLDT